MHFVHIYVSRPFKLSARESICISIESKFDIAIYELLEMHMAVEMREHTRCDWSNLNFRFRANGVRGVRVAFACEKKSFSFRKQWCQTCVLWIFFGSIGLYGLVDRCTAKEVSHLCGFYCFAFPLVCLTLTVEVTNQRIFRIVVSSVAHSFVPGKSVNFNCANGSIRRFRLTVNGRCHKTGQWNRIRHFRLL